ncbi:DUF4157 domain-containing protein [Anabaena sp. UHCC 0399]|uniref:eCIS core domain-containing protein n=1 Tax=Anabaena sp. UHCC 0399 TaxID=3110238 RepID=UPI002B1F890F|nr:DUF4157 domain-containing protein [Anabaena sp. UHCC 0399]MEA5567763.1 DUF4157 domain-containing protein [Anabaena sp. UHCC 0399]
MERQHLSQGKNALAQLTVRVASRREGIASPQSQSNAIARHSPHPIEELQSAIGNRAVNQLLANQPTVQTKPMFRGLSGELRSRSVSERESPTPLQTKLAKEADSASVSEVQPENKTGLPDQLKAGIEKLSGMAMDDVRVHYNSSKTAELQALAYTQGTDIHVAPGQEQHLPHEAWHVVQQKQGRVKPTIQTKGVGINDDEGLEKEADVMGAKAPQGESLISVGGKTTAKRQIGNYPVQCVRWWDLFKKKKKKPDVQIIPFTGNQDSTLKEPNFDKSGMNYEEKKRNRDTDKYTEGYYKGLLKKGGKVQDSGYPEKPQEHKKKWSGQDDWLAKLKDIESIIEKYKNIGDQELDSGEIRYNFYVFGEGSDKTNEEAPCRLCKGKPGIGHTEYQIKYRPPGTDDLILVRWPVGFKHYVEKHNVIPSKQFYDFVNAFDIEQESPQMDIILNEKYKP